MEAILHHSTQFLDTLRSAVLRVMLGVDCLRSLYVSRAPRLFFLHTLATGFYLTLSLLFPLWVLFLGPLIQGYPHLAASARYVARGLSPELADQRSAYGVFSTLLVAVAALRIGTDLYGIELTKAFGKFHLLPELLAGALFIMGFYLIKKTQIRLSTWGVLLNLGVLAGIWFFPIAVAGILVLAHNVIAYFFWYRSVDGTTQKPERKWVIGAFGLFVAVNVFIFMGWFDFIYQWFTPAATLPGKNLDYPTLGKSILYGSKNYVDWFHAVVAYAFGQSMHYFVWLKAIPDQEHTTQVPTTFTQSNRIFRAELGEKLAVGTIVLVAGAVAAFALLGSPVARTVYLAFASAHGFFEIAALSIKKNV